MDHNHCGVNRRKFLKYAGATAAVVGASAFGVYCLTTPQQFTGTSTKSTTSAPAAVGALQLAYVSGAGK